MELCHEHDTVDCRLPWPLMDEAVFLLQSLTIASSWFHSFILLTTKLLLWDVVNMKKILMTEKQPFSE